MYLPRGAKVLFFVVVCSTDKLKSHSRSLKKKKFLFAAFVLTRNSTRPRASERRMWNRFFFSGTVEGKKDASITASAGMRSLAISKFCLDHITITVNVNCAKCLKGLRIEKWMGLFSFKFA